MNKIIVLISSLLIFGSCDYFKQETKKIPVARVNKTYLYEEDVKDLISENTSKEDSILIVSNYINRWATQQLLIDQAKINLSQDKLDAYNKLVEEYKTDLLTEAYKSVIVGEQLDSTLREQEFVTLYDSNKENFRLKEVLVKVRYLHVDESFSNLNQVKSKFERFNTEDKQELNDLSIQFKAFNFNDSTWVKEDALIDALPVIQSKNTEVLKKSNLAQLQDSLGVYLVKIEDILYPNDIAPLSYVRPTIEQIILNKRKLELIKKLEKDITKDAIKNKKFETYSNK